VADDKREIILDLLARDKSGKATDSFARNLNKLGHTADDTKRQIHTLDKEVSKHEANLKGLAKAYAETDDKATRMDLSKAMRGAESEIKKLSKSKSILAGMLPDEHEIVQEGESFGKRLMGGISSVFDSAAGAGPLIPALAGMAAAAAPFIGATISAAVIGGAGIGGVVGGVMLAANDPRVKSAAGALGKTVTSSLQSRAITYFAEPLIKSIGSIQTRFTALGPDIDRILSSSAKFLPMLTEGVGTFATRITQGIADLVDKAGPVIESISNGIAGLGDVIGNMFTAMSQNGVAAATAMNMAFGVLDGTVVAVSATITGLTEAFGLLAKYGAFGHDAQVQYFAVEIAAKAAADASRDATDATAGMSDASKATARVLHGEVAALSDLSAALKAETDPAFGFLDAQDKMTKAHKAATAALKEHGRNSPQYRDAVRAEARAALVLEDAAGKVAATSNGKMTPALKATLEAAGMTAPEIAEVGRQMDAAHRKGNAFARKYEAHVAAAGASVAKAAIDAARIAAQRLAGTYTVRIRTIGASVASAALQVGGLLQHRAVGGPVSRATPYLVGERGPELFVPNIGGTVVTAGKTRQMMAGTGGGGSAGGGGRLVLDVTGAEADMVRMIRKWVRTGELAGLA
jgi:hypothetical protein